MKIPTLIVNGILLVAIQGCSMDGRSDDTEVIRIDEANPLHITSVEITRTHTYTESVESRGATAATTMLRGLDAAGDEVATVSLRSGIVSYSYDDAQWFDTPGREGAVHLRPGAWDVTARWPGFTADADFRVPRDLESFVAIPAVERELTGWGVRLTSVVGGKGTIAGGVAGEQPYNAGAVYHGHPCSDRPDLYSPPNLGNIGEYCALDDADRSIPYESVFCGTDGNLKLAFFNYAGLESCAMSDGSNDCGVNSPSGRMCTWGPCYRGFAQNYRNCAGDCSVGWNSSGANFTCAGCSGNGCSWENGTTAGAGCSYTQCCYNASTGQSNPC